MSLADHDNLFMPDKMPSRIRHLGRFISRLIALTMVIFPSFDLGRFVSQAPNFEIPSTAHAGDPLLLFDSGDYANVFMNGRRLARVEDPESSFLGFFGERERSKALLQFVRTPRRRTLKTILSSYTSKFMKHPEIPYFTQVIQVGADLSPETVPVPPVAPRLLHRHLASTNSAAFTEKNFAREDGTGSIACFREPTATKQAASSRTVVIHSRKNNALNDAFHIGAVANGEVTETGEENGLKTVLVYHGGGLFSQYAGLRELKVHSGQKSKLDRMSVFLTSVRGKRKSTETGIFAGAKRQSTEWLS